MEATPSAAIQFIYDFLHSLSLSSLIIGVLGYLLGIFTKFVDGYIKSYFVEKERRDKHKREVARQVLKLCNEASTNSFRKAPRDMEHINSVLTDLEGIDKDMSVEMEKFSTSWQLIPRERSRGDLSSDDARFLKSNIDRAERKRKILISWANKIRAGN